MTIKSSISLTDEQHAFAKELVEVGRYSSLSAVLQRGIDLLRERTETEELERAALEKLLGRRRKGAFVTGREMDKRLNAMIAGRRRVHAVRS